MCEIVSRTAVNRHKLAVPIARDSMALDAALICDLRSLAVSFSRSQYNKLFRNLHCSDLLVNRCFEQILANCAFLFKVCYTEIMPGHSSASRHVRCDPRDVVVPGDLRRKGHTCMIVSDSLCIVLSRSGAKLEEERFVAPFLGLHIASPEA